MTTNTNQVATMQAHYTHELDELLWEVYSLSTSQPLTPMVASLMEDEKRIALARIESLQGFLEALRITVNAVNTTLIRS